MGKPYPPYTEISGKRAFGVASEIAFVVCGSADNPNDTAIKLTFKHARACSGDLGVTDLSTPDVPHDLGDGWTGSTPGTSEFVLRWWKGADAAGFADALTYIADEIRAAVARVDPNSKERTSQ